MTGPAKEAPGSGKLYEIVRDELIDEIKSGAYPPGALLPSMREITVRWTVSTTTARKVLSELAAAGWARSQGTKGYVAAIPSADSQTPVTKDSGAASSGPSVGLAAVRSPQLVPVNGSLDAVTTALDVRQEPAPAEVALALRLAEPRASVVVRRRLAVDANGSPVQLRVSYTLREVAEGTPLASSDTIDEPWLDALAGHTHKRLVLAESVISARHPNDTEAAMLALAPTACVLVRVDVVHDEAGRPVDCTMTIWPGDTTRINALPPAGAE
ncbi:GntR family transcriptional regulator [Actinomadura keratinilytica]|jgi:DNA-binding GntR family transcriptional regulator|uniref:HTH gntR-type domain-containing protein n=1 Tax=Actinomadura keratinilytica TaxID=547461 RepID=A0ABP7XWY7_9ACTN